MILDEKKQTNEPRPGFQMRCVCVCLCARALRLSLMLAAEEMGGSVLLQQEVVNSRAQNNRLLSL